MLIQLYRQTSPSANPSSLTNTQPGGAGVITTGSTPNWGISAPTVEPIVQEVYDCTAPTLITSGVTAGTPAAAGKLLVADLSNGAFGSIWKLNSAKTQPCGMGTFGIVYKPATAANTGTCVGTANGNISQGDKALVVIEGPAQAFVQTTVNATAISAGMALAADGAGNLTYAGASPNAGTVLAIAAGTMSGSISAPALMNVYVGGF